MPTNLMPELTTQKEYTILPEDTYEVVIHDIEDKERAVYQKPEETEQVMQFVFRVVEGEYKDEAVYLNVKPKLFQGNQGLSPSNLYQIFSAVNKKKLDEEDLEGINTESVNDLIGKNLRIVIKHSQTKDGQARHKIDGFLPTKS